MDHINEKYDQGPADLIKVRGDTVKNMRMLAADLERAWDGQKTNKREGSYDYTMEKCESFIVYVDGMKRSGTPACGTAVRAAMAAYKIPLAMYTGDGKVYVVNREAANGRKGREWMRLQQCGRCVQRLHGEPTNWGKEFSQ